MKTEATFKYAKYTEAESEKTPEYKEYRRQWHENPKDDVVGKVPLHLDLESTSACNLKCVTCFQSFAPPPKGFMSMELYKKIIDEATSKGLYALKLMYRGESLLHPNIVEMVKYAKDKGVLEVMINSNCTLLTEEKAKGFIDAGLDKLICSVDGYEKETYEKIRRGAKFEVVLENIQRMQRLKKELGKDKPKLRVQMVDSPANHHQIDGYIHFWGRIADEVGIEDMNDWTDKKLTHVVASKEFKCPMPWQRLIVHFNGKVSICCGNIYGKLIAGDLNTQTVEEVWNGEVMQKLRKLIKEGKSHCVHICSECGFRGTVINKFSQPNTGRKCPCSSMSMASCGGWLVSHTLARHSAPSSMNFVIASLTCSALRNGDVGCKRMTTSVSGTTVSACLTTSIMEAVSVANSSGLLTTCASQRSIAL